MWANKVQMRLASSLTANEVVNATQAEYSLLEERSYYIKKPRNVWCRRPFDVSKLSQSERFLANNTPINQWQRIKTTITLNCNITLVHIRASVSRHLELREQDKFMKNTDPACVLSRSLEDWMALNCFLFTACENFKWHNCNNYGKIWPQYPRITCRVRAQNQQRDMKTVPWIEYGAQKKIKADTKTTVQTVPL